MPGAVAQAPVAVVAYVVVALLGALVGAGELALRYRDNPARVIVSRPAVVYMALNVLSTLTALFLIRKFEISFGIDDPGKRDWTQILVAGFGAITFFRTSFFFARFGDTNVGIGPSTLLEGALAVADRGVDRRRARARAEIVTKALKGVRFSEVSRELPAYCFALMQHVSPAEQEEFGRRTIQPLERTTMHDEAKALALGLALMNVVGEEVLIAGVEAVKGLARETDGVAAAALRRAAAKALRELEIRGRPDDPAEP